MLGRKVIFVRCISCSYTNVTKGIRLLDIRSNSCLYRKIFMQVRAFERYTPLNNLLDNAFISLNLKLYKHNECVAMGS